MKPRTMVCVLSLSVLLSLFAASFSRVFGQNTSDAVKTGGQPNQSYAELEKAPQSARSRQNPLAGDSAVAAGKKLFARHCAACHGSTAQGGKKGPSLWVPEVQTASPGMLFWVLSNGVVRRGMPDWSKLPEPQRWQLVSYLKSLK